MKNQHSMKDIYFIMYQRSYKYSHLYTQLKNYNLQIENIKLK